MGTWNCNPNTIYNFSATGETRTGESATWAPGAATQVRYTIFERLANLPLGRLELAKRPLGRLELQPKYDIQSLSDWRNKDWRICHLGTWSCNPSTIYNFSATGETATWVPGTGETATWAPGTGETTTWAPGTATQIRYTIFQRLAKQSLGKLPLGHLELQPKYDIQFLSDWRICHLGAWNWRNAHLGTWNCNLSTIYNF